MDELFLTGTGNEIMPVIRVNDKIISDEHPGQVTRRLQKLFFELTYGNLSNDRWWSF